MKGGEVYTGTLEYYKSENNRKKNLLKGEKHATKIKKTFKNLAVLSLWGVVA
jgi:hypothetical protein